MCTGVTYGAQTMCQVPGRSQVRRPHLEGLQPPLCSRCAELRRRQAHLRCLSMHADFGACSAPAHRFLCELNPNATVHASTSFRTSSAQASVQCAGSQQLCYQYITAQLQASPVNHVLMQDRQPPVTANCVTLSSSQFFYIFICTITTVLKQYQDTSR